MPKFAGQSAGGSSATNQVVAYGGRNDGLVHGVIATSGTSIGSDAEPKDNFAGWASCELFVSPDSSSVTDQTSPYSA